MSIIVRTERPSRLALDPDADVRLWEYEIAYERWIARAVAAGDATNSYPEDPGPPPAEPTDGYCAWCGKPASIVSLACHSCGQPWDEEVSA